MDPWHPDVIVADAGLGSLLVGYLLAERGRSVGIVERSLPAGTTAVSVASASRVEPVRAIVDRAPVISRRSAVVLQPESGLSVGMASERYTDAASAVAVVERSSVASALVDAIRTLGGRVVPGGISAVVDVAGAVAGVRVAEGQHYAARCVVLDSTDVQRLLGMRAEPPRVPPWALEAEWSFSLESGLVGARFSVAEGGAAEWWLYGDPFDGARGLGRIRAFGTSVTVGVVLPLDQVLERRIDVDALGERFRRHPFIAPLLDSAVESDVSGMTSTFYRPGPDELVGDGWVLGPAAHPFDTAPLSTEIAMAEVVSEVLVRAIAAGRITSARLSTVPRRLQVIADSAELLPAGPMDGWGDEFVSNPSTLADGLRAMAVRFARAG